MRRLLGIFDLENKAYNIFARRFAQTSGPNFEKIKFFLKIIFNFGKYTARHDYFAKTKVGAGSRNRNHDVKSSQISGVFQVRACWPKGLTPSGHDHFNHALDETTP